MTLHIKETDMQYSMNFESTAK